MQEQQRSGVRSLQQRGGAKRPAGMSQKASKSAAKGSPANIANVFSAIKSTGNKRQTGTGRAAAVSGKASPIRMERTAKSAGSINKAAAGSVKKAPANKRSQELKRYVNFKIPQRFDFSFFMIVLILLAFGLIMLFSATYASAKYPPYNDSYYFIKRQLIFTGLGFAAMIVLSFIDYHIYMNKFILTLAIMISGALMGLVYVAGQTTNGAERWLKVGEITVQPSEILKFVTIMVVAEYMQRKYDKIQDFRTFFFLVLRIGLACGLVFFQPHLSATIIIFCISLALLCIGGAKGWHIGLLVVAVLAVGAFAVFVLFPAMGLDYVSKRMLSFNDPEAEIQGATYQTYQSLISVGSGGIFGLGLGNSHEKYGFLPFTENDFIFSIICEELGFVGAMVVILLFIIFTVRGFYIASSAPDKFGMLLCSGIIIQLSLQALLNIAVVSNAIPNTGVSLPFISYGGTALIMQMAEMGVVLNISRKAALQ